MKGTGMMCGVNTECASGLCLSVRPNSPPVCTARCESESDCVPGWTCGPGAGESGAFCQCTPIASQLCGGKDYQCTGLVSGADGDPCGPGSVCKAGACVCETQCGGSSCIDTSADINNCGACGHVCRDGPLPGCSEGHCNYTIFPSSNATDTLQLAVDPNNLYWVDFGGTDALMKLPLGGGGATALTAPAPSWRQWLVGYFAIDAASVYWVTAFWNNTNDTNSPSQYALMKESLDGGTATTLVTGPVDMSYPGDPNGPPTPVMGLTLAIDATSVYWVGGNLGATVLNKMPKGGGPARTLASGKAIGGLAVDATSVYWLDSRTVLNKVPIDGGTVTTLASGMSLNGTGRQLRVDSTSVYWFEFGTVDALGDDHSTNGSVKKVALDGGVVTTVVSGVGTSFDAADNCTLAGCGGGTGAPFAIDATSLYWFSDYWGDGIPPTLYRLPLCGGTPTALASGPWAPNAIVVDSTSVYWNNGGAVMRLTLK
jgi:hypothetical protein